MPAARWIIDEASNNVQRIQGGEMAVTGSFEKTGVDISADKNRISVSQVDGSSKYDRMTGLLKSFLSS